MGRPTESTREPARPAADAAIRSYVEDKLKDSWSPELIAGRIRLDRPGSKVSHETIYQYVYTWV
ncbi:MAG: helix-turn-helix domain-containing protein [bacterium]